MGIEHTVEQIDQHYYTVDANNYGGVRKPVELDDFLETKYQFLEIEATYTATFIVTTPVVAGVETSSPHYNNSPMQLWLEDVSTKLHYKLLRMYDANILESSINQLCGFKG